MLKIVLYAIIAFSASQSCLAQDVATEVEVARTDESFIIQLTEYRLEDSIDPSLTAEAIMEIVSAHRENAKCVPVETIRLSALSGTESLAQFGRSVQVTAGTATTPRGQTMRSMQTIDIGSILKVRVVPKNDKVVVTLTYESSKIAEQGDEDSYPNIEKTQISSTQLLELGKPTLVSCSTTEGSSVFVLTVSQK